MIKPLPLFIRIISAILVITFLFQDIVWANPDIFNNSGAALQIQTMSKGIFDGQPDMRSLLKARLIQICALEDPANIFSLVEELKRRRLRLPSVERGIRLLFDFSKARYNKRADEWRVPCSAERSGDKVLIYTAYIGRTGLSDVLPVSQEKERFSFPQATQSSAPDSSFNDITPSVSPDSGFTGSGRQDTKYTDGDGAGMIPAITYLFRKFGWNDRYQAIFEQIIFWGANLLLPFAVSGIDISTATAITWGTFFIAHSKYARTANMPHAPPSNRVLLVFLSNIVSITLAASFALPVSVASYAVAFAFSTATHHYLNSLYISDRQYPAIHETPARPTLSEFIKEHEKDLGATGIYKDLREYVDWIEFWVNLAKYGGVFSVIKGVASGNYILSITVISVIFLIGGWIRLGLLASTAARNPDFNPPKILYLYTLIPFFIGYGYTMKVLGFPEYSIRNVVRLRDIEYITKLAFHDMYTRGDLSSEDINRLYENDNMWR
nr:hypothetical protein [Candidatus Omnitrophota bacterium]